MKKATRRPRGGTDWGSVPEAVSARMAKVRSRGTAPEKRLIAFLQARGLVFGLNAKDLPGCPDIVFRRKKVAVFVNGCFWHGHPGCARAKLPKTNNERWHQKVVANVRRDRRVRATLREDGWSALTIWECMMQPEELERFHSRLTRKLHRGDSITIPKDAISRHGAGM